MYLSRLILNPRSRQVQSELARPYQMHKTILRAFPDGDVAVERSAEKAAGVLFRLEEDARSGLLLLVQSQFPPHWARLPNLVTYLLPAEQLPPGIPENPALKEINLQLRAGQTLAFRLHANPTKRLSSGKGNKPGKRVALYKEKDQLAWLERKFQVGGARVLEARTAQSGNVYGQQTKQDQKNTLTLFGARFEGRLQVADPQALLDTLRTGIGSGKGMGFGLLSLAPARS